MSSLELVGHLVIPMTQTCHPPSACWLRKETFTKSWVPLPSLVSRHHPRSLSRPDALLTKVHTLNRAYSLSASCLSRLSCPISFSLWASKVLLHTCLPWQRTPGVNQDGVFRAITQDIPDSYHSNPTLEGFWLPGSLNCGVVKMPIPRSQPRIV